MSDIQKYNVWNKSKLSEYCKQKKLNVKLLSKIIQIFCSTTTTKLWKISRKHENFLGSKFFLSLNFSFLPTSISNFRSFVYNKKKKKTGNPAKIRSGDYSLLLLTMQCNYHLASKILCMNCVSNIFIALDIFTTPYAYTFQQHQSLSMVENSPMKKKKKFHMDDHK